MDNVCCICKKPFDDYLRVDCGGDCRICLAESGDPDCINGLVSEIERLREENNKLKLEFVSAVDKAEKYSRSAFSRNERNKELRSALTAILAVSQRYDKPTMNVITDCARAALKGDE